MLSLPLVRRWQTPTLLTNSEPTFFEAAMPRADSDGRIYVCTEDASLRGTSRYTGIECRNVETGDILWKRNVGRWAGQGR